METQRSIVFQQQQPSHKIQCCNVPIRSSLESNADFSVHETYYSDCNLMRTPSQIHCGARAILETTCRHAAANCNSKVVQQIDKRTLGGDHMITHQVL
jgi:hypothetical protein